MTAFDTAELRAIVDDGWPLSSIQARALLDEVDDLRAKVAEVATRLERGSGGKTDPFHIGYDAAHDLRAALDGAK